MQVTVSSARLTVKERAQLRWYLARLDSWLGGLPRHRRRSVLADIESGLRDAAGEQGMCAAIAELGPARSLAAQYQDETAGRPQWSTGALAVVLVVVAGLAAMAIFLAGMFAAVADTGQQVAQASLWGWNIEVEASAEVWGFGAEGPVWIVPLVLAAVFLAFSRAWRFKRR